jgi:hypothetical protein
MCFLILEINANKPLFPLAHTICKKNVETKVETHFPPPFFPFVDEFNRERKEKENGF